MTNTWYLYYTYNIPCDNGGNSMDIKLNNNTKRHYGSTQIPCSAIDKNAFVRDSMINAMKQYGWDTPNGVVYLIDEDIIYTNDILYRGSSEYTDTIKVHIKPWGWYTPDQAANKIVLNLTDISGAISNYISTITGYSYVKTEVTTEGNYVILNIRLKNISTLAEPISISLGTLILILAVTIIVIFGVITFIEWYTEIKPDTPKESRVATPGEQKAGTIEASNDANLNCLTGLPLNPTCDQIKTYAICLDSVHIGLYGTLKSEYPNSKEVEAKYNEYLNKYESISNTCTNPSETLAQIIAEKSKYLIDLSTTFDNLQKDYESNLCWIPSPISDGCLLSAKAGKTVIIISGILAGTYLIYKSKK